MDTDQFVISFVFFECRSLTSSSSSLSLQLANLFAVGSGKIATGKTIPYFLQKVLQPLFKKQFLANFFPWKHLLASAAYTHGQIVDTELTNQSARFTLVVL